MSKIIINKTKITTKIQERVLIIAAALNFAFFLVEIIFGLLINSNAIVSDSFDMLIDTATYLLAL
jgi:Co/Zn/Cd efflux system component